MAKDPHESSRDHLKSLSCTTQKKFCHVHIPDSAIKILMLQPKY